MLPEIKEVFEFLACYKHKQIIKWSLTVGIIWAIAKNSTFIDFLWHNLPLKSFKEPSGLHISFL